MVTDMSKHFATCVDSGLERHECPCPKCAEYKAALIELVRDEARERLWDSREQSRRIDAEYVNRRMSGGYK